jgi:hypothetical protein
MKALIGAAALVMVFCTQAQAADLEGPARFCGYSPIIDLAPGEKVTTLEGGVHAGNFRWEGPFGVLDVRGIGWAGRPKGRIVEARTDARPARFAQRRDEDGRHGVALWNGGHGAAYFSSPTPLTARQMEAIRRVTLFEEGQTPPNCALRTVFAWD